MRVAPGKLSSEFRFALLTALLFLALSGHSYGQTPTRSHQMSLYAYWDAPGSNTVTAGPDADVQSFRDLYGTQPSLGSSIVVQLYLGEAISDRNYDWSRILAVEIDEPYENAIGPYCHSTAGMNEYTRVSNELAQRQSELRAIAPWVRFWVNLSARDVAWLQDATCPPLNQSNIDVISIDDYSQPMNESTYQWLIAHRPLATQQVALVPGTFCTDTDNCSQQFNIQSYFDYANTNQNCNLGFGPTERTGNYDGCLIWMVMGWLSGEYNVNGTQYHGELNTAKSAAISQKWQAERKIPMRPDLTHQLSRGQVLETFLPVLLNN